MVLTVALNQWYRATPLYRLFTHCWWRIPNQSNTEWRIPILSDRKQSETKLQYNEFNHTKHRTSATATTSVTRDL